MERNGFVEKQLLMSSLIFEMEEKMNSNECSCKILNKTDKNKINRRKFITRSFGCTAGLMLTTFPGIITDLSASKESRNPGP